MTMSLNEPRIKLNHNIYGVGCEVIKNFDDSLVEVEVNRTIPLAELMTIEEHCFEQANEVAYPEPVNQTGPWENTMQNEGHCNEPDGSYRADTIASFNLSFCDEEHGVEAGNQPQEKKYFHKSLQRLPCHHGNIININTSP